MGIVKKIVKLYRKEIRSKLNFQSQVVHIILQSLNKMIITIKRLAVKLMLKKKEQQKLKMKI